MRNTCIGVGPTAFPFLTSAAPDSYSILQFVAVIYTGRIHDVPPWVVTVRAQFCRINSGRLAGIVATRRATSASVISARL